eukprot:s1337_g13.t1
MPIGRDAKGPGGQGHPFKCMWSEAWWQATLGPTDPSSGESEFIALVGGSSEALYIADCLRFLVESENLSVEVRARSDSAACRGITQRVGCFKEMKASTSGGSASVNQVKKFLPLVILVCQAMQVKGLSLAGPLLAKADEEFLGLAAFTLGVGTFFAIVYGTQVSENLGRCPRLFLHCHRIQLRDLSGQSLLAEAPLPPELQEVLDGLEPSAGLKKEFYGFRVWAGVWRFGV